MEIYTDGSCFWKTKEGGWGFCVVQEDKKIFEASSKETNTTISRMEIAGAINALQWLSKEGLEALEVKIISDSQYLVKTMNEGWNKFRNNKDLWDILDELIEKSNHKIIFEWTKGHSKNKWNDYVDSLASYKK